jgi:hypothetical protein
VKSTDSPFGDLIRRNDELCDELLVPPGVFAACPREPMPLLSFISEDMAHGFCTFWRKEEKRSVFLREKNLLAEISCETETTLCTAVGVLQVGTRFESNKGELLTS